jgi:hypothetical protein
MKYTLTDSLSPEQVIVCKDNAYFMASHACNNYTRNQHEVMLFPCSKDGKVIAWNAVDQFRYSSIEEFIGNECANQDDYEH